MLNTHTITKFIGLGLFFLGYWTITGFLELETRFVLSFSVSGFLFILFDFLNFGLERLKKSKQITKYLIYKLKAYKYSSQIALLLSVLSIVVLPHLPIKWESEIILQINDSIVLLGLGIVMFLIGLKSDAEFDDMLDRIKAVTNNIHEPEERHNKSLKQLEIELEDIKRLLNEKSNKI
ncbi:hypothetical protein MKY19_26925 [Paenibacillus sp. FSL R5-0744]|uniref:hypothetical protein n=1 Tax=Paenibacillus sp. FSL R5-0744 TaxID=2921656 RepID=UPI0030DCD75C